MATNYNPEWVYPQPIPGLRLRAPRQIPPPQYVGCMGQIVGYMPVYPQSRGCDLEALSFSGWLWVIILLIFFFPLAWVPCVMDSCYEPYQVPVYNHPQYTLTQPMAAREMPVGGTSAQPVPAGPGYAAPPPQATEMQAYPPAGWDGAAPTAPTPVPAKRFERKDAEGFNADDLGSGARLTEESKLGVPGRSLCSTSGGLTAVPLEAVSVQI